MKTRIVLGAIFATASVTVIGWQAEVAISDNLAATVRADALKPTKGPSPEPTMATGTTPPIARTPQPSAPAVPASAAPARPAAATGTFTGQSVSTDYGIVQVQVVVTAGKITDVQALHLTDSGGRSVQISNHAAPILRSEVLSSQSAKVSSVSGATYTSDGYLTSVQSALDQAHL